MKEAIIVITLSCVLFSTPTLACGCILNKVIGWLTTVAIPCEVASAGTAYFAKDEVTSADEKDLYTTQAISYGISAGALILAKFLASDGALAPSFASAAILAASAGIGSSLWEHLQVNVLTDFAKYLTKAAFYTGLVGFSAHAASTIFLLMKRYCASEPMQEGFIQVS